MSDIPDLPDFFAPVVSALPDFFPFDVVKDALNLPEYPSVVADRRAADAVTTLIARETDLLHAQLAEIAGFGPGLEFHPAVRQELFWWYGKLYAALLRYVDVNNNTLASIAIHRPVSNNINDAIVAGEAYGAAVRGATLRDNATRREFLVTVQRVRGELASIRARLLVAPGKKVFVDWV